MEYLIFSFVVGMFGLYMLWVSNEVKTFRDEDEYWWGMRGRDRPLREKYGHAGARALVMRRCKSGFYIAAVISLACFSIFLSIIF